MFSLPDPYIWASFVENFKIADVREPQTFRYMQTCELFCGISFNIDIRQANKEGW